MRTPWKKVIGVVLAAATVGGGVAIWQPGPASGGFDGTCLVSNREEWELAGTNCDAGTTIEITNGTEFECNQGLSNYGPLPLRVISRWSTWTTAEAGSVSFLNGCSGDGSSDTIDVIVQIEAAPGFSLGALLGDVGVSNDSLKFRQIPGPVNIQVTGNFDCGKWYGGVHQEPHPLAGQPGTPGNPAQNSSHQDVIQFQHSSTLDRNLWIVNGKSGDFDAGLSTCQGAGGIIFSSGTGVHILGGRYITCNNGMLVGDNGAGNHVIDTRIRSGRNESPATGGDPNCHNGTEGFNHGSVCQNEQTLTTFQNSTCEEWNAATNTWVPE